MRTGHFLPCWSDRARNARESEAPEQWNGLVGWWMPALGVTGDRLFDLSGRGMHACPAPASGFGWSDGPFGNALAFDGASEKAIIPSSNAYDSSSGTWCFWFKTDGDWGSDGGSNGGDAKGTAVLMERAASNGHGLAARVLPTDAGNGRVVLEATDSSGTRCCLVTGTTWLLDDAWHHCAATFNRAASGTNRLYVDGVQQQQGTNSAAWTFPSNQDVLLCDSTSAWWEEFAGQLDDVRIYNRELSPAEIAAIHRDPLAAARRRPLAGRLLARPLFIPVAMTTYRRRFA